MKTFDANYTDAPLNTTFAGTLNFTYIGYDHKLEDGDTISIGLTRYKIGSVVSSCLKDGDCPIHGIDRARKLGHELHFVFGLGTCLTAEGTRPDYGTAVQYGDRVLFEGRVFLLAEANNHNIKLVEVAECLPSDVFMNYPVVASNEI